MPSSLLFWDVDTQFDFIHPVGKLYVPGAETIISNLHVHTSTTQWSPQAKPPNNSWPTLEVSHSAHRFRSMNVSLEKRIARPGHTVHLT
jgi:nicotinamidase-related amidase